MGGRYCFSTGSTGGWPLRRICRQGNGMSAMQHARGSGKVHVNRPAGQLAQRVRGAQQLAH